MNKLFLIIAMLSATCTGMQAKVRLHHLIGDNMVVQADSKVNLWGWDTPGKTVTVSVSWSKARYTARAAAAIEMSTSASVSTILLAFIIYVQENYKLMLIIKSETDPFTCKDNYFL